jgi:hypothetical protein
VILARRRRDFGLQETFIGVFLDIDQIGNIDNSLDFGEVFPQKLVIRNRISHGFSFS